MKKQTSIKWLMQEALQRTIDKTTGNHYIEFPANTFEQAKEMHKKEIVRFWMSTDNELQRTAAEQYYKETYGGKDESA